MARTKSVRKSVKSSSNWSHENKGVQATFGSAFVNELIQAGAIIVPSVNTQGTRTVTNFTITIPVDAARQAEIFWALVYVPQGETAKNLFATTGSIEGSLYEPNQYVLASGISDNSAGPIRIRTKMSRKLHSGDFISLIAGSPNTTMNGENFRALVSYSIKYN